MTLAPLSQVSRMAKSKLITILSTFVFCYMATTTTKIDSFVFCMEVNGQLGCYDMYSGETDTEFPTNENFFGVKLNDLANPNFQSLHYGGFLFSISLNVSYLQIVNVTSREQKVYKLDFHPLALGISHNSPDNLYVIGVNLTAKCDEQGRLIFHYVTFSVSNCHDNERWPCPSSSYTLPTTKNCSEQIPLITLSPDANGAMVLMFEKSASDSLFCYSLTSYGQCDYPLGPLPQDYSIIAYYPYQEGIIFQVRYDDSKYKCYSFGYEGLSELPHECPPNARMVTPRTFRSAVSGASILYRNKTAPGGFEELNDVMGDPVEVEDGSGLVYVSNIDELTVKAPGIFGGKQTLTTQDPICKDAHNNALLLAMSENGKQLTVLLCPENQFRYLQGFVKTNGTYSPIPIHEKSVIKSIGPISISFILGIVKHQEVPKNPSTDPPTIATPTPLPMTLLIPIVLISMILIVVVVISVTVFSIACCQRIRRRRNCQQRNSSQREVSSEILELLPESERSSQANLIRDPQVDIRVLVNRENDGGPGVVQMPQSHTEQASQPPLGHEERGNENMSVNESSSNATSNTQQMTVPSSHENENSEPGNERRKSVEPASTQSPPVQYVTVPGSGVKPTIAAPPNEGASHQRNLLGSDHEDQLQPIAANTPITHESSRNTTSNTQQMTVPSSHENESSEPGNERRKSVEPASTQSPPVQDATRPGSGVKPTIAAPPNKGASHQWNLVGSDHEDQLQPISAKTPITHESSSNTPPNTQQMTVPSSHENESSELGNERKEFVEPASTQSPLLQDITLPGSGVKPTIAAPPNDIPASTNSEKLTTPIQASQENNPYHFAEMVPPGKGVLAKLEEIPKRTTTLGGN